MEIHKNIVADRENFTFIYSGLNSISDKGRKHLKNIAQFLIAIQNHPGTPIPDSICRDIILDSTNEIGSAINGFMQGKQIDKGHNLP